MATAARLMVILCAVATLLRGAVCAASELRAGPWPEQTVGREAHIAYYQGVEAEDAGDMAEAVRLWRDAVRLGNVEGAFRLADLYFPMSGSFGNERLSIRPSFVDGFVWLAIAAAGLDEETDMEGRSGESVEETLAMMERIMAPSERQRVAAILAEWPAALPPERPVLAIDDEGPYTDESAYIEALFQYFRGYDLRAYSRLGHTEEDLQARAFSELSRWSEAGDPEAKFAVAWCRLLGLGTERDPDAVMPYFRELASGGDDRALMALVHEAMLQDDEAAVDDFLRRAADDGNSHAMLILASRARERDDEAAMSEWINKAVGAGSLDAVFEMVSIGESRRDLPCMVQWLAAYTLAREGTPAGYRSRLVMAMLVDEMEDDAARAALAAGERWAMEHGGD